MFYRFSFFEDKSFLKVSVYGKVDPQGMRNRLALLANDHRWKREYKLLVDYSNVTTMDSPGEFGRILAGLLDEIPEDKLPAGIAYVFPERLFRLCFDTAEETHGIQVGCNVRFFREEDAAVDWLEKLSLVCGTEENF